MLLDHNGKLAGGRHIEWRMNRATYKRLQELVLKLEDVKDGSDDHMAILDDIRALGFPSHAHPERDIVHPMITDRSTRDIAEGR